MAKKSESKKRSKSERFETEDTLDNEAVAGYLEGFAKGLREGNIELGEEGEGFHAKPTGALAFVVKAKRGKRRTRINMALGFQRGAPGEDESAEDEDNDKDEENSEAMPPATIPDEMSF